MMRTSRATCSRTASMNTASRGAPSPRRELELEDAVSKSWRNDMLELCQMCLLRWERGDMDRFIEVGHRRVRWVDPDIFLTRFAPDCMAHRCRCRDESDRSLPDACCQHGADIDLGEKDAILRRAAEVASVLHPRWKDPA